MDDTLNNQPVAQNPWKLALEGSGVGVWDWNIATGAQTHSAHWEEMLGFHAGELTRGYQDFAERLHPQDRERVESAAQRFIDGQAASYSEDFRMRCKDGSWKWILTRGTVVEWDAQGRALRMIGTHTDINQQKASESELRLLNEQLRENAQLFQTTLASISQGIVLVDATGRVRTFNARVCELLDLPKSLLDARPLLTEVMRFQRERGDFGPEGQWVGEEARSNVMDTSGLPAQTHPTRYLRATRGGQTLEVRTQQLPSGGLVRTFTDVSDYVKMQADRQRLNELLAATQTIARVGGWERDHVQGSVFWTDGVYRILDLEPGALSGAELAQADHFFAPESRQLIEPAPPADPHATLSEHDVEARMCTAKGRSIWVRFKGTTAWEQGQAVKSTSVLQDISERKAVETAIRESEERWKLALESTGDGVWDWYIQTGTEFFSPGLLRMCGYDSGDLDNLSEEFDSRTHPDDMEILQKARNDHFEGRTPSYQSERRILCKDGSWKWVLSRGMVISRDAFGKPLRMIGTFTDISERKAAEALIWRQAFYDGLTGLPNRRMLRDRLEREMKHCDRDQLQLAVLFIDLDHFKEVNDTLGHDQGDQLLIEAARRLQSCVRQSDTVARMGGDEFTVVLTELPDCNNLEGVLQKILTTLSQVFQLDNEQVFVSASIGVTVYPVDAAQTEDLLKNADQALYVAKGAGRNRFSFFTPALQEAAQTRVRLAADLRTALADGQFQVVYQPIVELVGGTIHKAEALIRWNHPTRGLVSPAVFIPIAESSGLIVGIGEWVFEQAAQQVQRWRSSLSAKFQISVNRSPVQFHQDDEIQLPWLRHLDALGLDGDALVVEITEGLLLNSNITVGKSLTALRDVGIRVSLDDFGTGYSSLAYLQKFDIDFIKIDQSFVRNLVPDSTNLALCKAIIAMAHALGIQVVAEGVETEQQRDLLTHMGCDFAQGYFFSRPLPVDEFETFMRARPVPAS
ncbi:MAG: EAL domain-containing protein [Rhodoferax sp.]